MIPAVPETLDVNADEEGVLVEEKADADDDELDEVDQTAFLLTIAVLVDTFVVRIFVVPILMGFTGNLSWWPRRLST